ncbi:MAG TPA: DMT family transporter [Gemmataceae bacterium]|jgi:drug/metabolite transporter (DMT)-like permease
MASLARARLCVLLAALLWSTSGAFTKVLRENTGLGLNEPSIDPLSIAFWRVVFAATVLLPMVRRQEFTFRPALWLTGLAFALMNALFVSAMALGSSANTILLQYTAPMWVYLICVGLLREPAEPRGTVTLMIGLAGVGILLCGGWTGSQLPSLGLALGSGLAYAFVMIGLRVQRGESPRWVTAFNHLLSAIVLLPIIWHHPLPSWPQFGVLFLYGGVQMSLPYCLLAVALRRLSPQEAGTLTLIEPVLNPIWAYLASPATETPTVGTLIGGGCILGALMWRYWPGRVTKNDEG